ncbi:hypothetical protein U1Q18_003280 [Sarracenia purpurea var. burkii]
MVSVDDGAEVGILKSLGSEAKNGVRKMNRDRSKKPISEDEAGYNEGGEEDDKGDEESDQELPVAVDGFGYEESGENRGEQKVNKVGNEKEVGDKEGFEEEEVTDREDNVLSCDEVDVSPVGVVKTSTTFGQEPRASAAHQVLDSVTKKVSLVTDKGGNEQYKENEAKNVGNMINVKSRPKSWAFILTNYSQPSIKLDHVVSDNCSEFIGIEDELVDE